MNEKKRNLIVVLVILFCMTWVIYYIPSMRYSRIMIDDEPLISVNSRIKKFFDTDITPISLTNNDYPVIKVILINLKKRDDRLREFIKYFKQSDLLVNTDLYRIEAVYGKDHLDDLIPILSRNALKEFEVYKRFNKRVGHHSLTEGGMGCYMSHIISWNHIRRFNTPCIIAEDDVYTPEDTYANLYKFVKKIEKLPKNKPYIILFHSICNSPTWDKLECAPVSDDVYNAKQFWSLAFYYVTPEAADVLLQHSFPIKYQLDHMMSLMNQRGLIDIYYIKNIVKTTLSSTDIQVPLL
jgi:GR25 family glycosyltransferase involved in LPS biosynthesis